MFPVALGLFL